MTRVLSGAVLLAIAIALVWFASATIFFLVAEALLLISFGEYAALARANGTPVPEVPAALAAGFTAMAFSRIAFNVPWVSIDIVLMASLVVLGVFTLAQWKGPTRSRSRRPPSSRVSISACPSAR
jgi:CDP-diglyceride synthetase